MRYYKIIIRNKNTREIVRPAAFEKLKLDATYTSYVNGRSLRGALNVLLDIPTAPYALPRQGSYVRIEGVSLDEVRQSADLNLQDIEIYAGMKKGLPLAKPEQSQLPIVQGTIFQAFGNWQGTNMSLDLILIPYTGTVKNPINLTLAWRANTQLSDAIKASLSVAFPGFTVKVAISSSLVKASDETGYYNSLNEFAAAVLALSLAQQFKGIKPIGGGSYPGVNITLANKTLTVSDGTQALGTLKKVAFEDLIGQPTWIGPNIINFKTAIRSDISVSDDIQLPSKLATPYVLTTPGAAFSGVPSRSKSTFEGKFKVIEEHHFGNFRQADGSSWVTSFNASSIPFENPVIGISPNA